MDVDPRSLPDKEQEGEKPPVKEDVKTEPEKEEKAEKPSEEPEPQKGSQTPERNLYAALEEERRKRKGAELRLKELENNSASQEEVAEDYYSEEGSELKKELGSLKGEVKTLQEQLELERVYAKYPDLKDVAPDFIEYRDEYPNTPIEKVAKLFLADKGMFAPKRPGLEQPSGGSKTPPSGGYTLDDVKRIRETEPRKYESMLKEGKFDDLLKK